MDKGEYVDDCWILTSKGYVEYKDGNMQLKDKYSIMLQKFDEGVLTNPTEIKSDILQALA